ncbi:MAG: UvrB/UvrC motif-containing protein [Akkermansiaceae bacterium]
MKCQLCEQEASVTYTKVVGDKSQKIHLCAECADEKGITNLDNFNLSDILMSDEKFSPAEENVTVNLSKCTECGFTLDDLRKIGRLGCSSCYEQFGGEVKSMIGNMHKGTKHKGKVPEGMLLVIEAKSKLKKLQSLLDKAIADEEYEKAGELKNELATFKKSLPVDAQ